MFFYAMSSEHWNLFIISNEFDNNINMNYVNADGNETKSI